MECFGEMVLQWNYTALPFFKDDYQRKFLRNQSRGHFLYKQIRQVSQKLNNPNLTQTIGTASVVEWTVLGKLPNTTVHVSSV
eukprot:6075549-Amphidinium_carterae.1